jgi:hypothetical protein
MAYICIGSSLRSLQHKLPSQCQTIVCRMKHTLAIAIAALFLETAASSPLNIEVRQVSSSKRTFQFRTCLNKTNSKEAVQVHSAPALTKPTTLSAAIQSTIQPRTPGPRNSLYSSGVTAPAAPTGGPTLLCCKTLLAMVSLPLLRVVLTVEDRLTRVL